MEGPDHGKGRAVRLEVENFKSYRGRELIGPFKDFTTVIGPNGSGKSNLMDAISFVLGIKTGALRGSNLRELLYVNTDSQDEADRPTRGHVTLVFQSPEGAEVLFTRAILPSASDTYSSQYKIDGRTVSAEAYNARLESYGILVKARNFLVFQGDIENVAQMQPRDMTRMFEQVCGSDVLIPEFETAETRMKSAEERVALVFTKKRAITAEKRQKKEQKAEAERHMGLVADLQEMKVRHALWLVHHIEMDMGQVRRQLQDAEAELSGLEQGAAQADAAVEVKRREQAGLAKERLLLEKQIKRKKGEAEKKNPGLIKVREQLAHTQRRIKTGEREVEAARRKAVDHASKVDSLKQQLQALQDAQQRLQEELEQGRRDQLNLSPDLLEEYNTTKQQVGAKTSKLEADRTALQTAVDADAEALRMIRDANTGAEARAAELQAAADADRERLKILTTAAEASAVEIEQCIAAKNQLQNETRNLEARRAYMERRIEEADADLRDARADSKESHREAARAALVDELRHSYPHGVFGTLHTLADPTAPKYKMAMSVVMGRDFDSVVVDTPATAMACIQKVKERRMPPITFLPAETMRVKEIHPALRALGGTARVAIDCLHVKDERATRAFQAVCGSTLVCDTVEESRQLSYGGGDTRHKVVALDGTAFQKTGLITGGLTASMEERAAKWDDGKIAELKELRAKLATELAALPALRELTEQRQALEAKLLRLKNTQHYTATDAKATQNKVKDAEEQVVRLRRECEVKEPTAAKLQASMEERSRRVDAVQRRINEVADKMFAAFSKKIGMASIREYEDKHLKEAQRLSEQRMDVSAQVARVRNQLEYEQKADPGAEAARKEGEVAEMKAKVAELKKEEVEYEAAAAALQSELQVLDSRSAQLKASIDDISAEVKALRAQSTKAADGVAGCRRTISSRVSQLEQLRSARADVVQAAEMEELKLPTLKGRLASQAAAAAEAGAGAEPMEVDGEAEEGPSDAPAAKATTKVYFDYALLQLEDRNRSAEARRQRETEMKAAMEEVAAQLARMAPNLKAVEQYEAVREKEREQMEELEGARKEARVAAEAFNAVRTRRHDLFSTAFGHVVNAIDPIYKELTRSPTHPSGGQAYLSLEQSEDPYLGGIKFSAMPPTKRFRDMDQLSGGEKTVAALALLFAVHSFHPSPFFVLDEIDAALDASNVVRVASYMRRMTRADAAAPFQGIVISLKDVFFEKADALVGVCRAPGRGSSTTHTFDLERFDPPLGMVN